MSYYVSKVVYSCPHCDKPATHEVRGHRNENYGTFCEKHAEIQAKKLREAERKQNE